MKKIILFSLIFLVCNSVLAAVNPWAGTYVGYYWSDDPSTIGTTATLKVASKMVANKFKAAWTIAADHGKSHPFFLMTTKATGVYKVGHGVNIVYFFQKKGVKRRCQASIYIPGEYEIHLDVISG